MKKKKNTMNKLQPPIYQCARNVYGCKGGSLGSLFYFHSSSVFSKMSYFMFAIFYDRMLESISEEYSIDPYLQCRKGIAHVCEDVTSTDTDVVCFIIMRVLLKYAYPLSLVQNSHFTIGYTREEEKKVYIGKSSSSGRISHIITTKDHGGSISLNNRLSDIYE